MRHSFGTLLSKGGVAPRTAQAAMHHSTIDLTMNTYTDPKLLDVHGALDALPSLPLSTPAGESKRATGTTDDAPKFAVGFAVKSDKPCKPSQTLTTTVKLAIEVADAIEPSECAVTRCADEGKQPVSIIDAGCQKMETKRLELSTPALQRRCSPN